jgi:nucleotide-binding universal stress UspA family protein
MPTVLMAIDETHESKRAAEIAAECFGPDANYLAIYVDERRPIGGPLWGPEIGWGGVYTYPQLYDYRFRAAAPSGLDDDLPPVGTVEGAKIEAERLAAELGVVAEPLGDVGDPTTAIINAAHRHGADVIVVGSHNRNWFSKLLHGSTTEGVMRETDIPVLVVPSHHNDD